MSVKPDKGIPVPPHMGTGDRSRSYRRLQDRCQKLSGKALETWRRIMEDAEAPYKDRLKAAELIVAYGYGKPLQQSELTVSGNVGHDVVDVPLGLRQKMDEILALHPKKEPPMLDITPEDTCH